MGEDILAGMTCGHIAIGDLLLTYGADANPPSLVEVATLLLDAARNVDPGDYAGIIDLLLSKGAEVDARSQYVYLLEREEKGEEGRVATRDREHPRGTLRKRQGSSGVVDLQFAFPQQAHAQQRQIPIVFHDFDDSFLAKPVDYATERVQHNLGAVRQFRHDGGRLW